jgi:phosphoribosylformylglycinamidine synthase
VESALLGEKGARLIVPDGLDAFTFLFSESAGRAVVAIPRSEELRFNDMCGARGLPATRIGVVDGAVSDSNAVVEIQGEFALSLEELREAHEGTIPALLA